MPIQRSIALLRSASTPSGLVSVCAVALSQGVEEGLDLPNDTALVLWNAVRRFPESAWSSTATAAIGAIANASVVALMVAAVLDRESGTDVAECALDALSGPASAARVQDRDLLAIAERARGLRLAYGCANVIQAVCEVRRVPIHVVTTIVEGWSRRADSTSQLSALDLLDCLPEPTRRTLVEGALAAEFEAVRSAAAMRISEVFESEAGLSLVERSLTTEGRTRVVADLLHARAELLLKR